MEVRALAGLEVTGEDRRDIGIAKAAYFIASAMAKVGDVDLKKLLPIQPKTPEQSPQDMLAVLESLSKSWQPKASAPSARN